MLGFSAVLAVCVLCSSSGSAFAANPVSDLNRIGKDRSTSSNWSGYAALRSTFTDVSGSWTVPAANCSGMKGQQVSIASPWVGIDGYFSNTVEQTGTDTDCIGSTPYYAAWYEYYPAGPVFPDGYPVNAGDSMTARVYKSGNTVFTSLHNSGHSGAVKNWTLTSSSPFTNSMALSSGDWILEAPSNKLTNFGSVTFTGATANGTGLSSYYTAGNADAITMAKGKTTRATPTSPPSGNSFTVGFNNP